jgi:hypothetical protein
MKIYEEVEVKLHTPSTLFLWETAAGMHWKKGLQGQSGHGNEKNPHTCQASNSSSQTSSKSF